MLDVPEAARSTSLGLRRSTGGAAGVFAAALALAGMLADPAPGSVGAFAAVLAVAFGIIGAAMGALWALGSFSASPDEPVYFRASASTLAPGVLQAVAAGAALTLLIHAAAVGIVPAQKWCLALGVPTLFSLGVHGIARVARALGVFGARSARTSVSLLRQPGLWLLVLTACLYLPALGNFSLIDPWEPEYAEVARGMLSRKDWISLWWGDAGWFWSKPILDFALMAASLAWFGIDYRPEGMLAGIAEGRSPQPEWAVRFPIFVLALVSVYVLYKGTRGAFGRRAAWLGALILVTTPYWYCLSRQSMTDMPYIAAMTAALGFMLLALSAPADARVRTYEIAIGRRLLCVSGFHLLFAVILGLGLAQILYLLSRHVSLDLSASPVLGLHRDQVWAGSPGNCGLPGNAPCRLDGAAMSTRFQPGLMALVWAGALAALLFLERHERRLRPLYYLAIWTCMALAVLGKAAPGLVLPLCTVAAVLVVTGRGREFARCEWAGCALILGAIAAPWFVQEYLRHGRAFFDQLFIHDMYDRAFNHVHDTNTGDDTSFRYYVWQLGYGLFPWSGVVAAGALWCIGQSSPRAAGSRPVAFREATCLFVVWVLATFGLFSLASTKFHYYIAPLVPGVAMLGGALLDEWWQRRRDPLGSCLGLAAAVLVGLVARDLSRPSAGTPGPARVIQLFTYLYTRPWPPALHFEREFALLGLAAGVCCLLLVIPRWRRGVVVALCASGVAACAWCIDVYLPRVSLHWGQRENIARYYRERAGPEQPLVAYVQNWMGENFYTGNHVATFKVAGAPFKTWIGQQRTLGTQVLFFTTEHATVSRLRRELGTVQAFDLLTTPESNNKFVLARVTL